MGQMVSAATAGLTYYRALWLIVRTGGKYDYDHLRHLCGAAGPAGSEQLSEDACARLFTTVCMHTVGLTVKLWHEPHYRTSTLQQDLLDNLRNVCLPSSGLPLSLLCSHLWVFLAYFWFVHPVVVFVSAWNIRKSPPHAKGRALLQIFSDELLAPGHWFVIWRANSVLVAAHHHRNRHDTEITSQYKYENKWDFLEHGIRNRHEPAFAKIKMSPVDESVKEIVVKHKNIEGGMGVHCFRSAVYGGDWIIQERLENAKELLLVLPPDAPLSTYRVITMADPRCAGDERFSVATVVFRAGRSGKATDHSAVLLPIDPDTLETLPGQLFTSWYQVGIPGSAALTTKDVTHHPSNGTPLAGKTLHSAREAMDVCLAAHSRMLPSVPVAGWDVAVTPNHGAVLLEANLSCNFFGGVYDREKFVSVFDAYFTRGAA